MTQQSARCRHGHKIVSYEVEHCAGGHPHRIFTCRMRRGSRVCGQVVVSPPYAAGCGETDDG